MNNTNDSHKLVLNIDGSTDSYSKYSLEHFLSFILNFINVVSHHH